MLFRSKPFVTQTMIQHWVGSDHDNKDAMLGLLVELLNGGYTIDEMRADVLNLWECEEEV